MWRSWAGERQGSGQNRCKCVPLLTIPGGDRDSKGQLNMSVTHLAPNSEDTICSGPDTPQCLMEELWGETSAQLQAVQFRSHSLGKWSRGSLANTLCKMLTTWQGKSAYSLLSLIMSPLLLDVVWTHLTKVIWNIPVFFFFFSYLFLKVCWLFFLFGIAVLARGSGQLCPVSLNSSGLFPPKKL